MKVMCESGVIFSKNAWRTDQKISYLHGILRLKKTVSVQCRIRYRCLEGCGGVGTRPGPSLSLPSPADSETVEAVGACASSVEYSDTNEPGCTKGVQRYILEQNVS
jgi:hypothetical protein